MNAHDRFVGLVCVIACPAVTGAFLGLITALCLYPDSGGHALVIAAAVGVGGFAVNLFAIVLTAAASYGTRTAPPGFAGSASNRSGGRISR